MVTREYCGNFSVGVRCIPNGTLWIDVGNGVAYRYSMIRQATANFTATSFFTAATSTDTIFDNIIAPTFATTIPISSTTAVATTNSITITITTATWLCNRDRESVYQCSDGGCRGGSLSRKGCESPCLRNSDLSVRGK